ncbi:6001_t:CDS:2, partial [Acaulospora colombiana]
PTDLVHGATDTGEASPPDLRSSAWSRKESNAASITISKPDRYHQYNDPCANSVGIKESARAHLFVKQLYLGCPDSSSRFPRHS